MSRVLFVKRVDQSLLHQGFTVRTAHQKILSEHLSAGALEHGEKRRIEIKFGGALHEVSLQSLDFDREKYPNRTPIWRVLYASSSELARSLRETFSLSSSVEEYFAFCSTEVKDSFCLEPSNRVLEEIFWSRQVGVSTLKGVIVWSMNNPFRRRASFSSRTTSATRIGSSRSSPKSTASSTSTRTAVDARARSSPAR